MSHDDDDDDRTVEEQYEPSADLSVLQRWQLLHLMSEPIALGTNRNILSVLFRVLPPGRPLMMSLSAVAREAGVDRSSVVRAYQAFRAAKLLVATSDGKPTVNYNEAMICAIRSTVNRPDGERERRLASLQDIAEALGSGVNMKYVEHRLAEIASDPGKRIPGKRRRASPAPRCNVHLSDNPVDNPQDNPVETDGTQVQAAPTQAQRASTQVQAASSLDASCTQTRCNVHPRTESQPNSNLRLKEKVNGTPSGDAVRSSPSALSDFMETYGGRRTLIARVFDLFATTQEATQVRRSDLVTYLDANPAEATRVLAELCERGWITRVAHGRYRMSQAARQHLQAKAMH